MPKQKRKRNSTKGGNCGALLHSPKLPEHMQRLRKKLETTFEASGGKKVDIVSHSMGGLLVKSFLTLHHEVKISFTLKFRR
jgi:triacylglycerol esterase/lipase EstA (alpha/beta hydrolase family)